MMVVQKACPTVFTVLEDGTAVLLNVRSLEYYTLNKTAATLWKAIEEQTRIADKSLAALAGRVFEISEPAALADVTAFLNRLQEYKFVEVVS
jgi:hypothetical protein